MEESKQGFNSRWAQKCNAFMLAYGQNANALKAVPVDLVKTKENKTKQIKGRH